MNRKVGRAVVIAACLSLAAVSYLCFAGRKPVKVESGYQLVMGTFARVVVVAPDPGAGRRCIEAGLAEIRKVDELMSDYKSDSEISRINASAAKEPVQIGQWTYDVIKRSVEFSRLSGGAFDITVGPLVDLFRLEKKSGVAPPSEQVAAAKSKVGFEKLRLDEANGTVQFAVEGMRLDLGAIAKGYAVDKAIEAVQRYGAIGAMVDIGGNVRCFGVPPEGRDHWLVGVQDPNAAAEGVSAGGLLLTLKVGDASIATSGDYQQFALVEGKRHSHILDPHTGTSVEGLSGVTIITDNATDADALSTAVSVMGAEKGLALIEKLPNTEAILITSQPHSKIIKTPGADKYIR